MSSYPPPPPVAITPVTTLHPRLYRLAAEQRQLVEDASAFATVPQGVSARALVGAAKNLTAGIGAPEFGRHLTDEERERVAWAAALLLSALATERVEGR